jgi:hypothetical protein
MSTQKVLASVSAVVLAVLLSWLTVPANAQEQKNSGFNSILADGKVNLDFRYRYEFVDQENFLEDANASTLRTRLGFQSGAFSGFDFKLEMNDVREVIWDDFNAGGGNTPDRTQYPVVADPKNTRLLEGYLDYEGLDDWLFRLGRQRINFDNQRFVGAVAWRQTEQVFDALKVNWGNDKFDVTYNYVEWVRTIFGSKVDSGSDRQDGTHLLNASYITPIGKVVGYYYLIESDDRAIISTGSIGARLTGQQEINDNWAIRYEGEYASQRDAGNNPVDFSADYWHLDAGAVTGIFDFGLGWEVLTGDRDSDDNEAFRTPLATLHAFNGWADKFLATPAAGLDDKYVKFKATPGNWLVVARYHNFEAEDGGAKYGSEVDLRGGYKFNKNFRADLFLADFNGKSGSGFDDTFKFWVMASLVF